MELIGFILLGCVIILMVLVSFFLMICLRILGVAPTKRECIVPILCFIILIVCFAGLFNDGPVFKDMEDEAAHQFYVQTDNNMTNIEKYDLALSICDTICEDRKDDVWFPFNSTEWVEDCAFVIVC